jgi:hypothetical protein
LSRQWYREDLGITLQPSSAEELAQPDGLPAMIAWMNRANAAERSGSHQR